MKTITTVTLFQQNASRWLNIQQDRHLSIIIRNIVASPTVVDVSADYAKPITATSRSCKTQTEAMQEAKYMAIVDNKIDILVDMI